MHLWTFVPALSVTSTCPSATEQMSVSSVYLLYPIKLMPSLCQPDCWVKEEILLDKEDVQLDTLMVNGRDFFGIVGVPKKEGVPKNVLALWKCQKKERHSIIVILTLVLAPNFHNHCISSWYWQHGHYSQLYTCTSVCTVTCATYSLISLSV